MKFPHLIFRCVPQRWVVSVEILISLLISYMMRFCFALTVTEMTEVYGAKYDPHSCPSTAKTQIKNTTKDTEFHWTAAQQGIIHSGLFWGYFSTQILGGVLSDLFNHKAVYIYGLLITCIATAATPPMTRAFDWIGLIICRVIVGMSQGIFFNSLHTVTAHWIPTQERGTLGTVAFAGVQFGNALNTFITGNLLAYFNWSTIFYLYSIVGGFVVLLFLFTTYSDPDDVPNLSAKEKAVFDEYKSQIESNKGNKKVPVWAILKNYHVWAIFFAMVGQGWSIYTAVSFMPTYMKAVLHLNVQTIGNVNGIAYVLLWTIGIVVAAIADYLYKKGKVSLTWTRKSLYLVAAAGPAIGFIGVSYAECNITLAIAIYISCLSTLGLFYPSVRVSPMDLSPNFAGTIGAIGQMGGSTSGVILPYVVGYLTPNSYKEEWRVVLWISFAVVMSGGITFFILGTAKVQPFNQYKQDEGTKS